MISDNFARCIAKISGDGNLYYRYVRYSNTCPELLEEFKKDMTKEFGPIRFTEGTVNSGTSFVQVNRKFIINEFLRYLNDYKSDNIKVPNEIKNSNKSVLSQYLRAFYDDEGCVALRISNKENTWKRNITLTSNSTKMLKDIKKLLYNLNIKTNKIIRTKNNSNYDKSFVLSITGKDNITNFKKKIGFKHPNKIKKLNLMIKSYNATSKNKEAFEKLKREIYPIP